jgi:SAM-dependent methyltransferase
MISVITPAHAACTPYLPEVYASLKAQTLQKWEWVVLLNHGGAFECDDPRVKVYSSDLEGVGALKRAATELSTGRIIVELDGDDLLMPEALKRVATAFAFGADMVYSDFAEFHDRTWRSNVYSSAYGWESYDMGYRGLAAMHAPACTPQNVRSVMWAPNHVRAWRRDAALRRRVDLDVGDDQALFLDLYLGGATITHIPEPLYLYRVHPKNTVKERNARIQEVDAQLYEAHVEALALRVPGLKIDLCGGIDTRPGFQAADLSTGVDLNGPWPWKDGTVGCLRASDALEHLRDPIHVFSEAYRVLVPGGYFLTHTPSSEGLGADCDPTHVSRFNRLSWRYYTNPRFARYIPAFKGQFAMARPERRLDFGDGLIYTEAHFIALKEGYHHMGENLWR